MRILLQYARVEVLLGFCERFLLDVADLVLARVCLPSKRLIQKLQDDEEEGPKIILSAQLFLVMSGQTCIGDRTSEVSMFSHGVWLERIHIQMLFGKPEVHQIHLVFIILPTHHKVRLKYTEYNQQSSRGDLQV